MTTKTNTTVAVYLDDGRVFEYDVVEQLTEGAE